MIYFLLALSTCAAAGKAIVCKKIGAVSNDVKSVCSLNAAVFAVAMLVALCIVLCSGGTLKISPYSLLLAIIFSASILLTQLCEIKAMTLGNASLTILIYSCGFLLPVIAGALFWNEPVSIYQLAGILLLLLSLLLIVGPGRDGRIRSKWLFFSLLAMIFSGGTAIIQKLHQRSEYAGELSGFLVYAFAMSSLLSLLLQLFLPARKSKAPAVNHHFFLLVVITGVIMGALNFLNLTLAGRIPAVILFPVYNVGSMILTGIVGAALFGERTTKAQLSGFIIGCAAIAVIGML